MEMKRGGYYSAKTQGAAKVIANATPLVEGAIECIPLPEAKRPFVIADFGAADGGTSRCLMRKCVELVKKRKGDSKQPVAIYYEDQPRNDFSALFSIMHSQEKEDIALSPYTGNDNVFVYGVGTSFYQRCFPDDSLHFAFSATALHWLSELPIKLSKNVHPVLASDNEKKAFAAQAKRDWETILLHRAAELVPGGKFVVVMFTVDDKGQYLGNTTYSKNMFEQLNYFWNQMKDEGKITDEEYLNTNFPQYYRTRTELVEVFSDPHSPVSQSKLTLDSTATFTVKCPYQEQFNITQDGKSYAEAFIATVRSWSEGVFFSGLSTERTTQEKNTIVDEFYGRYQLAVEQHPQDHAMDYVHEYLVISKLQQ